MKITEDSPRGARTRRPIHSDDMNADSGNHRQSPSSSQSFQYATEEESSECDTNSNDYDDDSGFSVSNESVKRKFKDDSGTYDGQLTSKPANRETSVGNALEYVMNSHNVIAGVIVTFIFCFCVSLIQHTERLPLVNEKGLEAEYEISLRKDIENIREEFPSQLENIWVAFTAGIKRTARGTPTRPSVFMLLYETEEGTPVCLAQKIVNISTYFLNATKVHPLLIIEGADLEHNETLAEDYGILLEEYRPRVEEQRAMIINNLHKIPGTVAQSFHSLCDSETPAVDKAVYFFTMKASGSASNTNNPTALAEEELKKLWHDKLDADILNPLITRITDTTMMIKPEKNLVSCES